MTGEELVTTTEAAKRLGISGRTIQRYVAAGLIKPDLTLPSGRYRWDVDKLRDQINAIPRNAEEDPDE
jgi:DNA-binding transcriptional MerR regulator